jgi:2-polyprenyl-3-methyl-5-hydroxy-6-metoxy-1,4-benzoquinol methylase
LLPGFNMTAKEHYDHHLGNFYSWMSGDFTEKQLEQQRFFLTHNILPRSNKVAIDLGAGHGLQAVSLAALGFEVKAVDFNAQLLNELNTNKRGLSIEPICDDLIQYLEHSEVTAELMVCMGDTLTHLESLEAVDKLFREMSVHLEPRGKVVLSFRDLTTELMAEQRFIPVKSDSERILTCFLEYFDQHVVVYDILHERKAGTWLQRVSSYPKLRINEQMITEGLLEQNMKVISSTMINRMIYIIAEKF